MTTVKRLLITALMLGGFMLLPYIMQQLMIVNPETLNFEQEVRSIVQDELVTQGLIKDSDDNYRD